MKYVDHSGELAVIRSFTYETLPLSVFDHYCIFSSRQTPTDSTPRLDRLDRQTPTVVSTARRFYTNYFRRLAHAVVTSQQHGSFGQPSHKLCLAPASTPTQLDPPLDFLKSKSESKSISSYDVNPIYTCPTNLRTKTNSLHCTAPSHLYSICT